MRKSKRYHKLYIAVVVAILNVILYVIPCASKTNSSVTESQFEKEVRNVRYKKVNPPLMVPVFRWDFSKTKVVHTYVYEQEVRSKTDIESSFGQKPGSMEQAMLVEGALLIKSQGDKTAEMVLKDLKMSMKMDMGKAGHKTIEQQMPPIIVQGLKEDGSGLFGNSSQNVLLKMLFPLPKKEIKLGDTVDIPLQKPFNAMGSILQVTGRSRITLTQYVSIGKRTCAQLNVVTDISKLKVPKELKGEYRYSTKGTSVFYFDIVSRSFVSGTIAMLTQFSIDAPMPKMGISGEDSPDRPKRSKMSMKSDNLIRVKLNE